MDLFYDIEVQILSLFNMICQFVSNAMNLRNKCESKRRLDSKIVLTMMHTLDARARSKIGAQRSLFRGARVPSVYRA
jgi:hypothetical protein